ncbi:polyhomeotic-like protein 3 isoform X1 [Ictalurus punctatus]|uniref:Polyhomeotic-like protein 3 isoform X1 n=1 Tax=Ictalurus punctatus TaxID=7998 RepID=A0A2D0PS05_ICTPU|nr:polyhomeotic-like protein 3 isoform X1 [Ictalurus punctatus]XP_047006062.1 polyhomeotic-like protein 3 isoform X1 [Ictalurus punctatus]
MDKEPQTKADQTKSPTTSTTTSTSTPTSTSTATSAVSPPQPPNGTAKSSSALTAVTTFHSQPPPSDRKVAQVNLFGDRLAPAFSTAISSQQTHKTVSVSSMPGTAALVRASQSSSPTSANHKISPQALLVGKSPTSQTQMLLRAQMLILTSTVRPDAPVLSSSSSSSPSSSSPRFPSSQLQSLTLRPPPPGTLTIPPNLPLKSASPCPPPALTRARVPTLTPRPSPPPCSPVKDMPTKTECATSPPPSAPPKAPPVRHLTVPPPSLYAPAQSHALAKQKLSSSSLKRPHSQISIPQHPFPSRHPHPNSSPAVPKKPLPELKRCPSTQASPSGLSQTSAVPITVPNLSRSHLTPPTLTLPLTPTSSGGSLLATKQLLRIALSSASASASTQCTNGQPKSSTVSPSHDLVQPKPQLSPASAKPECPIPSPQNSNTCPQLVQLSPSRQTWTSPQRASPPSPVLPLVSTSSTSSPAPPQSPLASITHTTDTTKELKSLKPKMKPGNSTEEIPQDLKLPSSQTKSVEGNPTSQSTSAEPQPSGTVDKTTVCKRPAVCTEVPRSQKMPSVSVASTAGREDVCEETSTRADSHSAISSLSLDLSPVLSSMIRPSVVSPAGRNSPAKFPAVSERAPAQQPSSSHTGPTEPTKPLVLTHLVDGFIIQEGLEPFPVNRSSLMVGPNCGSGLNGANGPDIFNATSESPDNSTDSDDEISVTNNGVGVGHRLVLQCHFCKRKGTAQTFNRSKRFCSKSCAKRFSYTKRFRALRRCVSEGGHRSEFNGAEDEIEEESFQQVKHGTTEQWRILQRPPQEGEDEAAAPMKTRLRRHTEQNVRERETRTSETKSAPTSPLDVVSPTDLTSHSKPAQWTVDQVWSFISNLPGCQDIAESFRAQEIDGQALLLLTEDHLMSAMNVKLGPALKICARINSLKEGGR